LEGAGMTGGRFDSLSVPGPDLLDLTA